MKPAPRARREWDPPWLRSRPPRGPPPLKSGPGRGSAGETRIEYDEGRDARHEEEDADPDGAIGWDGA